MGDLISKKALLENLNKFAPEKYDALVNGLIEKQPTVNAIPVVRGYWEGYTRSCFIGLDEFGEPKYRDVVVYHCSECRRRSIIKSNFCPDCGADMRGGTA